MVKDSDDDDVVVKKRKGMLCSWIRDTTTSHFDLKVPQPQRLSAEHAHLRILNPHSKS